MTSSERLDAIEKLDKDWDSYQANPVTTAAMKSARELIRALESGAPHIEPLNDGGIGFSWLDESVDGSDRTVWQDSRDF